MVRAARIPFEKVSRRVPCVSALLIGTLLRLIRGGTLSHILTCGVCLDVLDPFHGIGDTADNQVLCLPADKLRRYEFQLDELFAV